MMTDELDVSCTSSHVHCVLAGTAERGHVTLVGKGQWIYTKPHPQISIIHRLVTISYYFKS